MTADMKEAEANLQALIKSSVTQTSDYYNYFSNDYCRQYNTESMGLQKGLQPFSTFLPSSTSVVHGTPYPPCTWPPDDYLAYTEGGDHAGCGERETTSVPAPHPPRSLVNFQTLFQAPSTPSQEEMNKDQLRQLKAALRKERNKEAARRSNLNKKLMRDQLEKKSLELWEENLQLHQEIRALNHRLRRFLHVRKVMRHVCQRSVTVASCTC